MAHVDRSYHGQLKRKSIGSRTLAEDNAAVVVTIDAGLGDLFTLITAAGGCGACDITLNVIHAHDGQTLWVRYDANHACDADPLPVQLNGTAITFTEPAIATAGDHLIEIKILDASDETTVVLAIDEIT